MGATRDSRTIKNAQFIVRSASILRPKNSSENLVNQIENLAVSDLAETIIAEKVCNRILDFLGRHNSVVVKELMKNTIFSAHITRINIVADKIPMLVNILDEAGCRSEIPILAIKGLCTKEYYTDPQLRDMGDIDIMVRSVDDAVQLISVFRDLGYTFERRELPWLKRDPITGNVYGQFNLKFSQLNVFPNIDIHFGGYSVRHCGFLGFKKENLKSGLSYLSLQENIPLLVGNAAGDHRITTKDLNDLYISLDINSESWDRVIAELDTVELLPFFSVMLYNLKQWFNLSNSQSSKVEGIINTTSSEWPQPGLALSWQRRWLATSKHAFKLGVRHSYRQAIIATFTAIRYYWKPRQLVVAKRRPGTISRMPELNSWTCIRLVPVELLERIMSESDNEPIGMSYLKVTGPTKPISSELSIIQSSYGDVVRSRIGDFLPTVFYGLESQLLELANTR
ncbi:MAG: hypothetical protein C0401_09940 [Anaerolinea sp.]|nr:hypothetical protein [Anaerolinea sp.]